MMRLALAVAAVTWVLPQEHRLLLDVEMVRAKRSMSAASVEIDLARFPVPVDPATLEVVGYDAAGTPYVYDPEATGAERVTLPSRVDGLYPTSRHVLSFVVPHEKITRYAVYADAATRADPARYAGPVGDGDFFATGFGRREVAPSAMDDMADLDGDGDLDLVRGGTDPYLRVFENVGGARYADRGVLTSGGRVLELPHDDRNRSWVSVELHDEDGDGDQDLFASFWSGPMEKRVVHYENTTAAGGLLTFTDRGPLLTRAGRPVVGRVTFTDWDGDGVTDLLAGWDELVAFHRGVPGTGVVLEDGVYLEANGLQLQLDHARLDTGDMDGDGDLDLVAGDKEGRLFLFDNVGTRTAPRLTVGRPVAWHGYMDAYLGVKVADFDGDGRLDVVAGRFWERVSFPGQAPVHGRLFRNLGGGRFESRDARGGAPFVEAVLPVDALRQNEARAFDWDGDGGLDLLAGDSDGHVRFFRNRGPKRRALFDEPVLLEADGEVLKVYGEEPEGRAAGYARLDVADWNADGRPDLLVADGRGWLFLYVNVGTRQAPKLGPGRRVRAGGRPLDGTSRGSVVWADWNGDGRPDVLFGMVGEGPSATPDWPALKPGRVGERGILFLRNVGTRGAPVLERPRWVSRDGTPIDMERPNLGDAADWNGDGLLDLVACEFELSCRLYTRSRDKRGRIRLDAPVVMLQPFAGESISGADVVDWNADGRLDLVTGQGHAGSSLRYFSRDYLEDVRRGTLPRVTPGAVERRTP